MSQGHREWVLPGVSEERGVTTGWGLLTLLLRGQGASKSRERLRESNSREVDNAGWRARIRKDGDRNGGAGLGSK